MSGCLEQRFEAKLISFTDPLSLSLSLFLLLFSPTIRIREGERSRPSFSRFLQGFAMFEEAMDPRQGDR